jgi:hypothetical protein
MKPEANLARKKSGELPLTLVPTMVAERKEFGEEREAEQVAP